MTPNSSASTGRSASRSLAAETKKAGGTRVIDRLAADLAGTFAGMRGLSARNDSDEELGYAQDQWPVVDRSILDDDRAPDLVVRGPSPYVEGQQEWWMLCRKNGTGPTPGDVGLLADRFPGLELPLRAGDGVWELAEGEKAEARWRRVGEDEIPANDEWQRLRAWVGEKAGELLASSGTPPEADEP